MSLNYVDCSSTLEHFFYNRIFLSIKSITKENMKRRENSKCMKIFLQSSMNIKNWLLPYEKI